MSEHAIRIEYQHDGRPFHITLFGAPLEFFVQASQKPEIKSLEGEKLAEALVAAAGGRVAIVTRSTDGVLNDGPLGEPAWQEFYYKKGGVRMEMHMKDGKSNDGRNGTPASHCYTESGHCHRTTRWKDGVINDGPNNEPADQLFNAQGQLTQSTRYRNNLVQDGPGGEPAYEEFEGGDRVKAGYYTLGKHNDGPNGEPALQEFKEGFGLHAAWRYKDGVPQGGVPRKEIDAFNAAADDKRIEAISTAFGAKMAVGIYAPGRRMG